jgi:ABC-type transporter Mla subunit MlaD
MDPISAIRIDPLSSQDKNIAVERIDNLINLLDKYRRKLGDPHVTLRTLEPVIGTIEKEKDQLSGLLETLPKEDGLRDVLNQTLITASLEVIKFNKGDYITS